MNALDALYLPLAIITAPWWARKTRSGWGERFGHIPLLPAKQPGVPRVLLHAVSVGEVGTLRGLVPMLRGRGSEVVVSVSTDTGLKRARELFENQPGVFVVRFALDFSPAVNRFLDAVRPDVVALVELEVWPNFVALCGNRGIPVGVINGRLSVRSFRGYRRFRRFFAKSFGTLAFVGAQDGDYAARFRAMGVPENRLTVSGSMKWDATGILAPGEELPGAAALARELGIDRSKPLIVAGSTAPMPGTSASATEDGLLHAAVPEGVQLLTAPRRPEHREAAFAAMGGPSRCVRRSDRAPAKPGQDRFLLDTIGELRQAYALADVVVIGRTFDPAPGGSDPIESVSLGKATVLGPHSANFEYVVRTFRDADAIVITDAASLPAMLRDLLADRPRREALAGNGAAAIHSQQGATARHADMILAALAASSAK